MRYHLLRSGSYVRMTLDVLSAFGVQVEAAKDLSRFRVRGGQTYRPADLAVEGDWSGAAFLLVAGAVAGQVTVQIQYRLLDRAGKVLLSKPNMEFRERYEIATNPGQYFDESEVAMQRLSADVSRDLVSAILDQF